ncbi:MAG: hypothetical protein OXF50_22405, partial [Caldilineaceae bacterium]|nr:hypothetical protein [Caldilineaceae bacterium]
LRPRNAPSPTTCLVDLVSIFVTGDQSKELRQTTSRKSNRISADAGLVPAQCHPINVPHRTARPCACPASLQKPVNNSSRRWH